jgi:hypothetical protein
VALSALRDKTLDVGAGSANCRFFFGRGSQKNLRP